MIDWLNKLRDSKKLVIVEGEKDKEALQKLGIKNVVAISRKPLFEFIEEISNKYTEVIILTDLDSEGRKLYSKLKHNLQKNGVKIDNQFREILFRKTHISQIEGIFTYFRKSISGFVA
jgi:5S rRNA maturation endonuclease (ribonuclease M5)